MPWNKYAQTNPLIVFCISFLPFFVMLSRQNWIHLVPITFLGINAGLVFLFWTIRLNDPKKERWSILLVVGHIARIIGLWGFVTLLALLVVVLAAPQWLECFNDKLSVRFWLLWTVSLIDLIHSHIYKLTYGRYTMEHILAERRWNEIAVPLGGAIGQQIRKIRRNYRRTANMPRKA